MVQKEQIYKQLLNIYLYMHIYILFILNCHGFILLDNDYVNSNTV